METSTDKRLLRLERLVDFMLEVAVPEIKWVAGEDGDDLRNLVAELRRDVEVRR